MTIEVLIDLKEENFFSEKDRKEVDLLLQAINDWPNHFETVEEYLTAIKIFLKTDILNYYIINSGLKKLNPEHFAWQMEALSSLLEITETNKDVSIETRLQELKIL
jgi:hypothetical protein